MDKKHYITMVRNTTLLLCLLFTATHCAVTASAGKVTITNRSDKGITNIKVGETILSLYVPPGGEVSYWYITGVRGTLRVEGADFVFANNGWRDVEDPTVSLALGFHYQLNIKQDSSENDEYTAELTRSYQGDEAKDTTSYSDWISD